MTMDRATADALRSLGSGFNLPEVQALYAPLLAAQPRDGVRLHADLAYGPHARHRLDVYQPTTPAHGGAPRPVLVWLHGGGFIRGDKAQRANVGWWGARQGFVTVLPNYRLAPDSRWPSGPEDVVAVWQWLRKNATAFDGGEGQVGGGAAGAGAGAGLGGGPSGHACAVAQRTVLVGESAGAAHVAAACLMRRFQPPGWLVAGAVLLSGPYNARLEGLARTQFGVATPDPRNDAYLGSHAADWRAASIVDQVDATPLALLISATERDLLQMQVQAGELFARLVSHHGFAPQLQWLREHNHFSQGYSIGTADDSLAAPLAAFVRRHTGG